MYMCQQHSRAGQNVRTGKAYITLMVHAFQLVRFAKLYVTDYQDEIAAITATPACECMGYLLQTVTMMKHVTA